MYTRGKNRDKLANNKAIFTPKFSIRNHKPAPSRIFVALSEIFQLHDDLI